MSVQKHQFKDLYLKTTSVTKDVKFMASVNEFEETLSSITLHSYISIIVLIVNITGITQLYSYFKNNNIQITGFLKLTYFPFISWIFSSLLFVILNNHTFPQLNDTFSLIDDYCHILCIIKFCFIQLKLQSLSIFLLTRLKHTFQSTSFKIKWYEYNIQIIICFIIAIWNIIYNFPSFEPTIYIAMDNPNYKLCHIQPPQTVHLKWNLMLFILNDVYLYYLCFKKFQQYRQNIARLQDDDEQLKSNVKHLKIAIILLFVCKIMVRSIVYGIRVFLKIKYGFGIIGIIDCFVLLYCVDSNVFIDNNNGLEIEQESPEDLERRLQEIMTLFYAPPPRLSSQEMNDTNEQFIPLIQIEGN